MSYRHHLRVVLRVAEHGVNDLQHGGDASAAGHLQERQVTTDECGSKGGVGQREGRGTQAHGHNECDTGTGVHWVPVTGNRMGTGVRGVRRMRGGGGGVGGQAHGYNKWGTGPGVRHRHRGTRGTTFARGTHVVGENKRR